MDSAGRQRKASSPLRIILCGTPQFAVPTFTHLLAKADFEILAAITQPDRPRGRGHQFSFSPVKELALARQLAVHQPEKIRAPEIQDLLERLAPDAIVIIAYGQIVPSRLLSIPRLGWINLHASLLPRYRGAAPINWAIANGETRTGLTTIRINAGMDSGDILLQREMEIGPTENARQLTERLSEAGAPLVYETLRGFAAGAILPHPQDHSQATLAPMLKKEDGRIDWNRPAQELYNHMRGFVPWPGAYTTFRGQTCHLSGAPAPKDVAKDPAVHEKGSGPGMLFGEKNDWFVLCGRATFLRLQSVTLEGRKQVSAGEFANGARLEPGERFGQA